MTDYRDIFGDVLADHHEAPRNFGLIQNPNFCEKGFNPLCGDQVTLACVMSADGKQLTACTFEGEGCSICMASTSIMTEMVQGKSKEDALRLIEAFREKMQGQEKVEGLPSDESGEDITALYGVKRFPVRIKCALLPWTTLKKGLMGEAGV